MQALLGVWAFAFQIYGDFAGYSLIARGLAKLLGFDSSQVGVIDQIFDADGTAVVIHADADDGRTDPSGNAGSRVRCGVLEQA